MSKIPGLLGPEVSYVDMLDEHLMKKQQAENDGPRSRWPLRPSAAGFCARKLAFDLDEFLGHNRYEPEVRKPSVHRLLNFGHAIESHVLYMFKGVEFLEVKYKQQALSFFPVSAEKIIEGSIDFVFYSKEHKVIGDVKSKGVKYSSYRNDNWEEYDDKLRGLKTIQVISDTGYWVEDLPAFLKELRDPFFAQNFIQLNFYALNPFITERGINHAVILQYAKNDSRMREVRFKPSQEVYDYVETKFKNVYDAVAVKKDPYLVQREFHLGSMSCAFCVRNKECYDGADARKEFFGTLPDKKWARDTNRLGEVGEGLEALYTVYKDASAEVERKKAMEDEIVKLMDIKGVNKVRFSDGRVFELKFLKSPRPHVELRPSKN